MKRPILYMSLISLFFSDTLLAMEGQNPSTERDSKNISQKWTLDTPQFLGNSEMLEDHQEAEKAVNGLNSLNDPVLPEC